MRATIVRATTLLCGALAAAACAGGAGPAPADGPDPGPKTAVASAPGSTARAAPATPDTGGADPALPHVHLIATGGTISNTDDGERLTGEEIVASVPGLDAVAVLTVEQFSNIASGRMTPELWLDLARHVKAAFREWPDLAGVVITHGTDTMEETAYFLDLVLGVDRPVTVVGAMRNSARLSSDGEANFYNAVRWVAHPGARGRGVTVVMNDLVLPAREATKTNTSRVNAFDAGRRGPLAVMDPDTVALVEPPGGRPAPLLDPDSVESLPRVDIIYSYAGADGALVDAAVEAGAAGLVFAAVGRGGATPGQWEAMTRALEAGVHVVASSRTMGGRVPVGGAGRAMADDWEPGEGIRFGADSLTPQKARILLMVGLHVTSDPAGLLELFRRY
ncbi:MAG: asparaginase [Longimicrobiales bacterium]|nr:asparaginase [Longimicrobiales bacterium]